MNLTVITNFTLSADIAVDRDFCIEKASNQNCRKFHYTVGERLDSILESGEIKVATAYVDTKKEKPAVFCSTDKVFEPTAYKALSTSDGIIMLNSIDMMMKFAGPLVRIEIKPDAAPYTWEEYVKLSGITKKMAKALERSSIQQGSHVKDFYMSFSPITKDQWLSIQVLNEDKEWETFLLY